MEQVKAFIKRLHLPVAVGEKALEYCRLAEVKCCSGSRGAISPSCLAVICIDLACVQLGEPFDKVFLSLKFLHSQGCHNLLTVNPKEYAPKS